VRDIPWRHALVLTLIVIGLLILSDRLISGWTGLGVSLVIFALYFVALRLLMVREYRRFPHGRS
jgi:hypothetical protein